MGCEAGHGDSPTRDHSLHKISPAAVQWALMVPGPVPPVCPHTRQSSPGDCVPSHGGISKPWAGLTQWHGSGCSVGQRGGQHAGWEKPSLTCVLSLPAAGSESLVWEVVMLSQDLPWAACSHQRQQSWQINKIKKDTWGEKKQTGVEGPWEQPGGSRCCWDGVP